MFNLTDLELALKKIDELRRKNAPLLELVEATERALRIAEKVGTPDSSGIIRLLRLLGIFYLEAGNPQAEPCLRRALASSRRIYGQRHPNTSEILGLLANTLRLLGRLDKAESCYLEAHSIDEERLGPRHTNTLAAKTNLAVFWLQRKDLTKHDLDNAQKALEYVRAVDLERLGPWHEHVANNHENMSSVLAEKGDWSGAEREVRRALEILEKKYPHYTIKIANLLGSLANLIMALGSSRLQEALELLQQALEIDQRELGPEHPDIAGDLAPLAIAYVQLGQYDTAFTYLTRAVQLDDGRIGNVFTISSENQRLLYLNMMAGQQDLFLSLVFTYLRHHPDAVGAALDLVLRRKAIVAESVAAQREATLGERYPALAPQLNELTRLQRQVAHRTLAGPGTDSLAAHSQILEQFNIQRERLEAELAQRIPEINVERRLRNVTRQVVAEAIPEETVLVEIVRIDIANFHFARALGGKDWQPARYVAFILSAGKSDNVHLLDLGEADAIDLLIKEFRQSITGEGRGRNRMGAGKRRDQKDQKEDVQVGSALRKALFDPLVPALSGRKRLLIAPDSELTLLPFEVLPLEDSRPLIAEYKISYLSTGRDLLRYRAEPFPPRPQDAVVIAAPDFDLKENFWERLISHATGGKQQSSSHRTADDQNDERWDPLPGAQIEGEQIAALLGVPPLIGAKALKSRLRVVRSPRVLHLATHGGFSPNLQSHQSKNLPSPITPRWQVSGGTGSLLGLENPLLWSRVALAGANTWREGRAPKAADNGLFTAEDVALLDLRGTDLVVLSACDTARGKVHIGEGVIGLRRAFTLTGARVVVMSLWSVDDLATAIFMKRFYEILLSSVPCSEALRKAQNWLRNVTIKQIRDPWLSDEMIKRLTEPLLKEDRNKRRSELEQLKRKPDGELPYHSPSFWGAFICQGDPVARLSLEKESLKGFH